jgi:hypothetical protein
VLDLSNDNAPSLLQHAHNRAMWCRAKESSACQSYLVIGRSMLGITWYSVSSSQWGLIWDRAWATRLCSLAMRVCIHVRTNCSFTRISPEIFQVMQSMHFQLSAILLYSSCLKCKVQVA